MEASLDFIQHGGNEWQPRVSQGKKREIALGKRFLYYTVPYHPRGGRE